MVNGELATCYLKHRRLLKPPSSSCVILRRGFALQCLGISTKLMLRIMHEDYFYLITGLEKNSLTFYKSFTFHFAVYIFAESIRSNMALTFALAAVHPV